MFEGVDQPTELGHVNTLGATGIDSFANRIGIQPFALLQAEHIELGRLVEQAAVVSAGFHQQGKARHLRGTVVNVQAVEVFLQNQARYGSSLVAALQVDGLEHVVGDDQYVAAAAGRVEHGDGLRIEAAAVLVHAGLDEGIQLRMHLGRLLGGLDVIRPLAGQSAGGVGHEPQAAHAVLHQVLHDPVGGEKLGGGGYVFAFDDFADDLVFFLADVELVEPADDFDLGPVLFGNRLHQLGNDGVGAQQVVGQQQFGVVVDALEQKRHGRAQRIALGDEQQPVQLAVAVAGELHVQHLRCVQAGQAASLGQIGGVGQDVGQAACGAGQRPVAVAQVIVQLHEAQRSKAVEPGVGDGFQGLGKAVFVDAGNQVLPLAMHFGRPGLAGDDGDVALRLAGGDFKLASFFRQAQQVGSGRNGGDKVFAGLRGVGLEFGFVHGFL